MKNKALRITIIVVCVVVILWLAMFATDYFRSCSLKPPLFALKAGTTADDGGTGIYHGLGYTVSVEKYVDAEYGLCISSVEMKMLGKVIAASIT